MRDRMVTAGDICITAMTQSRLDQELLALEIFGFLCRSEVFSWVIATSVGGLAEVCCWRQSRLDFAHRKYCGS